MGIRRSEEPGIPWIFWPTAVLGGMSVLLFVGYQLGLNDAGASSAVAINMAFWGGLAWFSWGARKG